MDPRHNDTLTKDLDDVLKHYGVKGMKWGIRRKNPTETVPASDDAVKFKQVKYQIKTSGTKSLTNQQLKEHLERIDLEQRYHKANPSAKKKAAKIAGDLLLQIGKEEAKRFATNQIKAALSGRS